MREMYCDARQIKTRKSSTTPTKRASVSTMKRPTKVRDGPPFLPFEGSDACPSLDEFGAQAVMMRAYCLECSMGRAAIGRQD